VPAAANPWARRRLPAYLTPPCGEALHATAGGPGSGGPNR